MCAAVAHRHASDREPNIEMRSLAHCAAEEREGNVHAIVDVGVRRRGWNWLRLNLMRGDTLASF